MRALGVYTALQFREMDPAFVRKKLGVVGERLMWELRGMSCLQLEEAEPKKSITCSRSFGKTLTEIPDLAEALASFVNTASQKLRQQNCCAKALHVYLEAVLDAKTGTRRHFSTTVSFQTPTSDTSEIISASKRCLEAIFSKGQLYKKCGIVLLELTQEANLVPDLFLKASNPKRKILMRAIDALNARFGKNKLFYGAMGTNPQWKMRSDKRSPHNTTNWENLPVVKA